jgi:hypothetical protein
MCACAPGLEHGLNPFPATRPTLALLPHTTRTTPHLRPRPPAPPPPPPPPPHTHSITLSIFPGVLAEDVYSAVLGTWYPVALILLFNLADWGGKVGQQGVMQCQCTSAEGGREGGREGERGLLSTDGGHFFKCYLHAIFARTTARAISVISGIL